MSEVIEYHYKGLVERPDRKGSYQWKEGYSENGNIYPWLTKREGQKEAKKRGCKASFIR